MNKKKLPDGVDKNVLKKIPELLGWLSESEREERCRWAQVQARIDIEYPDLYNLVVSTHKQYTLIRHLGDRLGPDEMKVVVLALKLAMAGELPERRPLIRRLELFGFLLPPRVKHEVYEPAFNDLLEDFLINARRYNTKWARRWIGFCLVFRAGWLVVGSLWEMCRSVIEPFVKLFRK